MFLTTIGDVRVDRALTFKNLIVPSSWIAHYSVGVIFAFSFLLIIGETWLIHPQFYLALLFGVITVLIPFFIMQPAMGSGFASSKTPHPFLNCFKSLLNHSVFGCGLYLTAKLFQI